ncbi:large ribosomal subunit protein bL28 [endosymbiont GvMRE of Glomus versiforme]|uniref:large ribosomal subunit protein bL28 n=1 Tax=endosymbiont GvMRE of Glomus versiforme TaxID=2039283 RepID=UPI000EC91DA4|nr:hypothetical protein [endosymbiont GvMRE of Glomus versiforme]RHZ35198.1 50S ribosomal protein L28 [endosymbiont GvMRE of Glomus versiforme]
MSKTKGKKILGKKIKPLAGNNRSFSMQATKRKFATNRQIFRLDSHKYYIPVKLFWTYWKRLKQNI